MGFPSPGSPVKRNAPVLRAPGPRPPPTFPHLRLLQLQNTQLGLTTGVGKRQVQPLRPRQLSGHREKLPGNGLRCRGFVSGDMAFPFSQDVKYELGGVVRRVNVPGRASSFFGINNGGGGGPGVFHLGSGALWERLLHLYNYCLLRFTTR